MSDLVRLANQVVPMRLACRAAGFEVPEGHRKGSCPLEATEHSDGGREPAFRVYAHDAWCFACRTFWTPVKLAAYLWDTSPDQAAVRLLDFVGYKPVSYAQHWQAVSAAPEPAYAALGQALRNYCAAIDPYWPVHQLEAGVAEYLSRCLGFLVQVKSDNDARDWFEGASTVMRTVLLRRTHANP